MIKQYKMPTLIGMVLLVVGIAAGVFLIQSEKIFKTGASPEETPKQVRITNLSDKSFTVSWITDKATQGFISYGTSSSLGTSVQQQSIANSKESTAHHTVVDNLSPNTNYYFKVGSGGKLFDNNGQLYQTKTANLLSGTPTPDIIFGTITDSSSPVQGVLVYVNLLGVTPISSLTDSSGRWSIPLSTARNTTLNSYAEYTQGSILEIFVQSGVKTATAKVKTQNAHPVPPITLGQNQDFTNVKTVTGEGLPTSQINLPNSSAKPSGFTIDDSTSNVQSNIKVTLTSPSENESLNTPKPVVLGTGTPKTSLTIKIESVVINGAAIVDSKGNWSFAVPQNLDPGKHTITVSWKDENNQTRNITRAFTVLAQGSSSIPAFTASSSGTGSEATPIPTSTPKPTPTPVATSSASARTTTISTSSAIPQPGNLTGSLGLFIIGVILVITGLVFPKIKNS